MRILQPLLLGVSLFAALGWAGDFAHEAVDGLPEGLPDATVELLSPEGVAIKDASGAIVARYWGRKTEFEGEAASGFGIRFDTIPEGALIAVVHFPEKGSDFREQEIPSGVYTLRYSLNPEDGNHMGVAPSRDFAVLTPAAGDTEPARSYPYDDLIELTNKVGNPHPTIARIELPEGSEGPNLWQNDYEHWVLDLPSGGDVVGIVVYGHSEE